jgi:hypothetical protein
MKNNIINSLLIIIAYFSIGLLLSQCYFQQSRLKVMNDSINRLIIIELITEMQFNLLNDKIKSLEKKSKAGLVVAERDI